MPQVESLPTINMRTAVGPPRVPLAIRTGALEAAGAYDAAAWFEIPMGVDRLSLAYTYTLVDSTIGSASLRPAYKNADIGATVFRDIEIVSAIVGSVVVQKAVKELQIDTPVPPVTSVSDVVVLRVPPGMTHIAIPAAESGDTAHPGTLACWIVTGV